MESPVKRGRKAMREPWVRSAQSVDRAELEEMAREERRARLDRGDSKAMLGRLE